MLPDEISKLKSKPTIFSNWSDPAFYRVAIRILPFFAAINFITPNMVTIASFLTYSFGAILLFLNTPYHNFLATFFLLLGYLLDHIDGDLARYKKMTSEVGDYLDKVLDVLKIFIITISLGIAAYTRTSSVSYLLIAFSACFFFNFRYYIKLETLFSQINQDPKYLEKSHSKRVELIENYKNKFKELSRTSTGQVKALWLKNRSLFVVDEAEFAVITAVGAILNQIELALILIATAQIGMGVWRFFERLNQIQTHSPRLLWPMRK